MLFNAPKIFKKLRKFKNFKLFVSILQHKIATSSATNFGSVSNSVPKKKSFLAFLIVTFTISSTTLVLYVQLLGKISEISRNSPFSLSNALNEWDNFFFQKQITTKVLILSKHLNASVIWKQGAKFWRWKCVEKNTIQNFTKKFYIKWNSNGN